MNSKIFRLLLLLILGVALISPSINAKGEQKDKGTKRLNKTEGTPIRALLNINNISTVIKNDGISDIDRDEQNSGFVYPKGSGKTAVFQSGFLWGVRIEGDPQVRVGGNAYSSGLQGGKILDNGKPYDQLTAEPTSDPQVRIFRVRPDVYPGGPQVDLSAEVNDNEGTADQIRAQYETDWTEWPAQDGAPFNDVNGNGTYEPDVDIPGVTGADQTIWSVANDLNPGNTADLYGALPLGVEQQATYWAYNRTGALGNMIFRKYKIINKSNTTFHDMYVSMWSDVDDGNATDDFAGCDTMLSLGYCYNANANDATYSPLPPPAVGFDFFQGPLVDGVAGEDKNKNGVDDAEDYGIFNGQKVGPGKINLPMTAFYYFARGDANVTDPTRKALEGSTQFYNFFQGRIGKTGDLFVNPVTNETTPYVLTGDPVSKQGWIDGMLLSSGDRRIGQASGPFTMAPGDTQEVVVAEIVAGAIPGVDRLSAIGLLKFYDKTAQDAFDNFFDLPIAPPAPEVNIPGTYDPELKLYYALDKKIVLDWGENSTKVSQTENFDSKGYKFEGYNVYQLPNAAASVEEGKRIATYDIVDGVLKIEGQFFDVNTGVVATKVQQFGNDTGIKRYLEITSDEIKSGVPLVNGNRYYFAVTAYAYNPDATITNLENPISILTIVPTAISPGYDYNGADQDTLPAAHTTTAGNPSDGNLFPIIIDPSALTGMQYTVTFDTIPGGTIVWNVDRSDGVRVLANQTNQNADEESPIADGIQFRVQGAPLDVKGFDITANANGPITGAECTYEITSPPSDGNGISADWFRDVLGSPNGGALSGCVSTPMQAAGGYFFFAAGPNTVGDHTTMLNRITRDGDLFSLLIPNNYEIRWTGSGKALWPTEFHDNVTPGTYDVPFELWFLGPNLDDPSDDVRMIPVIFDNEDVAGVPTFNFILDHEASSGNDDPYSDLIYFYMPGDQTPGDGGYQAFVAQSPTTRDDSWTEHLARVVLFNWNENQGDGSVNAQPEVGTVFRIRMTVPNALTDVFTFAAPKATYSQDQAVQDVNKINVYPNPYYGVNSEELNKYNRFVTFTHLPTKVTIRLFNLAGVMVRTIEKDNSATFQRWDLANESGLPVASGLYIAYIDMPEVGRTKILKVAIIQEQQILDRF